MTKIVIEELQDNGQFVSDLSEEELDSIDGGLSISYSYDNGKHNYYVDGKKTSKKKYDLEVKKFNKKFNHKFHKAFDFSFDDFF